MVNVKNLATDKQKDRRKSFVKKLVDNMVKFTIAANDAFVRSIQSIGYKSTGAAAAEIVLANKALPHFAERYEEVA